MSSPTLTHSQLANFLPADTCRTEASALIGGFPRHFWYAAIALFLGVFFSEHDLWYSTYEDFAHGEASIVSSTGGGNIIRRLTFFWMGGVGLTLLFVANKIEWKIKPLLALTFIAPLAWGWISLLWSTESSLCIRRLTVRTCSALACVGIGRLFTLKQICWLALFILGGSIGIGVLAELGLRRFRPWSGDYRFSGTQHPNPEGMYLAACCFAAVSLAWGEKKYRAILIGIALAAVMLLVLTKSRSATAALVITFGAVLLLQTTLRFKLFAGLSGSWLMGIVVLAVWLLQIDALRELGEAALMGRKEASDTLSGRNFIWPLAQHFIDQRPWFGYGFESFWTADHVQYVADELQFPVMEAHNGYLEVQLSTGRIGLGLHLLAVFAGIAAAARALWQRGDASCGLITSVLIYSLLSACFESTMFGLFFVTLVAWAGVAHLAFGGAEEDASNQPATPKVS
ncbi:O-antigen ligase family protein [Anatilimnocola floriformis]|uniref:O-antigen ligase family protein n=1 Tax=Anatilimnocola floriformis TaxID=2948575 RepID=UPI0020C4B28B|nr:O-antigen ligase family protein [Anatilimnocola floriformis]